MNCYECAPARDVPAVAVCQGCGVAVCTDHVRVTGTSRERSNGMGPALTVTSRSASCPACAPGAAHHTVRVPAAAAR